MTGGRETGPHYLHMDDKRLRALQRIIDRFTAEAVLSEAQATVSADLADRLARSLAGDNKALLDYLEGRDCEL